MFKDETGEIVPAIVDEELWEQANKVLKKRSEDVKGRQGICHHANLLTGKLYCADCGTATIAGSPKTSTETETASGCAVIKSIAVLLPVLLSPSMRKN